CCSDWTPVLVYSLSLHDALPILAQEIVLQHQSVTVQRGVSGWGERIRGEETLLVPQTRDHDVVDRHEHHEQPRESGQSAQDVGSRPHLRRHHAPSSWLPRRKFAHRDSPRANASTVTTRRTASVLALPISLLENPVKYMSSGNMRVASPGPPPVSTNTRSK